MFTQNIPLLNNMRCYSNSTRVNSFTFSAVPGDMFSSSVLMRFLCKTSHKDSCRFDQYQFPVSLPCGDDEGFYTWYTLALNVFQEFDLDAEDFSDMDKWFHKIKVPFKKVVHNNYIQKTKDKLSKLTDNSKLYLYNKIKHDIVLEVFDT